MEDASGAMIPSRASYYYYVGRGLPQGSDVSLRDLDLNDFTPDQTASINLQGLRHFREHNADTEIGRILEDASHDDEKFVIGRIGLNDPIGRLTVMEILEGKTKDLSLTHNYGLLTYPGLYIEMKEPTEISSVETGNRPDCRILWGVFDTDLEEQSIGSMADAEMNEAPPLAAAPPKTSLPAALAVPARGVDGKFVPAAAAPPPAAAVPPPAADAPGQPSEPLPADPQDSMFSQENLMGLNEDQKTALLIEFSKNNSALKTEMKALDAHKKSLEEEQSAQFLEQKKALVDMVKEAGGQVESLEVGLQTLSPEGLPLADQNRMRGTLVAVTNSVKGMAEKNKELRVENERLKQDALAQKSSTEHGNRFNQMMDQFKNSAPHPARFESSDPTADKKRKLDEGIPSEETPAPRKAASTPEADAGMIMFNAMRDVLSNGTGHPNPWGT